MKTLFFGAAALALLSAPAVAQTSAAPTAAQSGPVYRLTAEQCRQDLRFMAAEMEKRHRNLYHAVSREAFAAAVADLDARIPNLKRNEIIVGLMRIAAMVGDGHTNVSPLKDARFGFPSLPLKLYLFEDGLYVRAARPAFADLLGSRIEAVGGVPVAEAIRRVAEIAPRDNDFTPKLYVPVFLAMPDILEALKLSPAADRAELTLSKGKRRWTVSVPVGEILPNWPSDTDISLNTPPGWVDARATPKPPMWLEAPLEFHRLIDLPGRNALYAQLNMVTDIEGETLAQFGERLLKRAGETNPRAIVLDLRLNRGGNGSLRTGLVRALIKAEDDDTRLFVLTGRGTFSASQFLLDDLDRLTGAVFVGEPASSKPNSYGDSYRMPLPNSGITVRSSIYYWQADQANRPWTPVDVAAPLSFEAYAAGDDPALEAALAYAPVPPVRERLVAAATEGGAAGVRRLLAALEAGGVHRYADDEIAFAEAAERLGGMKKFDEAVAVAELGLQRYPESGHINTVLAFVDDWAGRPELALKAARRAVDLDPNNRPVRLLIEKLDKTPSPRT